MKIRLKSGFTGEIIAIAGRGTADIRPPFHRCGILDVKGIKNYIGYVQIIPDNWEKYYSGEYNEREIVEIF